MTILIDVDGVIFNTQETLLNWLNIRYNTNYTIDDITSYDWFDNTFDDPWSIMEHDTFWYTVKANKLAIDYILKWKHEGHTIKFVTASYYHHALYTKIHKLLDSFNGEFDDKDVIICHNKDMIKGDLLIDDNFDNAKKFSMTANQPAVLYSQPWNIEQFLHEDVIGKMYYYDNWHEIDAYVIDCLNI